MFTIKQSCLPKISNSKTVGSTEYSFGFFFDWFPKLKVLKHFPFLYLGVLVLLYLQISHCELFEPKFCIEL